MRSIPDPGFAGDDGGVDPVVAAALAAYDGRRQADEPSAHLEASPRSRTRGVLVPVVAMLDEVEYRRGGGLPRDKTSDMAAVLMTGRDGRTALLAFTGTASLDRWARTPGARPDRSRCRPARRPQAALQDQAAALLVDVAGPVLFVVEGEDLRSLAAGHRLLRLDDGAGRWVQPCRPR